MKRLSLLLAAIMLLCMQSCGQRVEQQTSLESEKNLTDVRLRQDVTFLQRYFARMTVLYPIGESRFYD